MTRTDLAQALFANKEVPLTITDCERAVLAIFNTMTKEMGKGKDVIIRGIGTWKIRKKPERVGRNPKNGDPATIRARTVVSFKAGKKLKEAVDIQT